MKLSGEKSKIYGIAGTTLFHAAIIGVLLLVNLNKEVLPKNDGGGIFVVIGEAEGLTTENQSASGTAANDFVSDQKNITQNTEKSISVDDAANKEKKEAEKREKEEQEKNRIDNLVSGAFKTGTETSNKNGKKGSQNGNADFGAKSGNAGYGSYNLGERGLKNGEKLPRPEYDGSNDEGTISILITVNPEGRVISAQTTPVGSSGAAYSNRTLRTRAVESAKKAIFSISENKNNQQGSITYIFKQK